MILYVLERDGFSSNVETEMGMCGLFFMLYLSDREGAVINLLLEIT